MKFILVLLILLIAHVFSETEEERIELDRQYAENSQEFWLRTMHRWIYEKNRTEIAKHMKEWWYLPIKFVGCDNTLYNRSTFIDNYILGGHLQYMKWISIKRSMTKRDEWMETLLTTIKSKEATFEATTTRETGSGIPTIYVVKKIQCPK